MKWCIRVCSATLALSFFAGAAAGDGNVLRQAKIPLSLLKEADAAIDRGVNFLLGRQQENGSWLHDPAVTALSSIAINQSSQELPAARQEAVAKARSFILQNAREDGAICSENRRYANYSTALCLSALAILNREEDVPIMKKARSFLIGLQLHEDNEEHPTSKDNPFYGGIGYGSAGPKHPDLSNTQWALEALYLTDHLAREPYSSDPEVARKTDLAWDNALRFLAAVQKLPESSDGVWIVSDSADGGFIYAPDESKADDRYDGNESLRSYGSMTYAGLKSMIYANLQKEDPRVQAAADWARRHYTLDENPGIGAEGHYYYLQTFAKAHAVYGEETVITATGRKHYWREDLVRKLLELQQGNGQWLNDKSGRWQESIPELVTGYALISLEVAIGDQLP